MINVVLFRSVKWIYIYIYIFDVNEVSEVESIPVSRCVVLISLTSVTNYEWNRKRHLPKTGLAHFNL